jgi:two-component system response regulator DegU
MVGEVECNSYRKKMTVLIVEDNAGIRRLLRRTLLDSASAVWECFDGADALAIYENHRPDVVLMDIRMPRMDGLTATKQIREFDPSARIVIVTDYEDEDLRAAAFQAGACGYALKQELSDVPRILCSLMGTG